MCERGRRKLGGEFGTAGASSPSKPPLKIAKDLTTVHLAKENRYLATCASTDRF